MNSGIDYEIPYSKSALVPIGKYFVRVLRLIAYHLVKFSTFEFHLFFVELVFDDILASLLSEDCLFIALLLIVDLLH